MHHHPVAREIASLIAMSSIEAYGLKLFLVALLRHPERSSNFEQHLNLYQ